MRVLLLGASGLLSRAAALAFLAGGHDVTAFTRGGSALPEPPPGGGRLDPRPGDRRDPDSLARAIAGERFDFTADFLAFDAGDVERLFHVPRAALGRYALISSGQVYLVTADPRPPFREPDAEAPLAPEPPPGTRDHSEWAYGMGKRRAEAALRALRAAYGVRGVALRLPVIQGAGDAHGSRRLWAWLERLCDGGPVPLPEGGGQRVRFLHADDAARALVTLATLEAWPSQPAYNLAQPDEPTLREFLSGAARAAGVPTRFVDVPAAAFDGAALDADALPYTGRWCSRPDPARAVDEWGFSARASSEWLPGVVQAHLAGERPASHPGYAGRAEEIARLRSLAPA